MIAEQELVVMEDHDGAYYAWKRAGFRDKTLLHFDAHLDFAWIATPARRLLEESSLQSLLAKAGKDHLWSLRQQSSEEKVHLGNYVHEAITAGIVSEFVWVYPDAENPPKQFRAVAEILNDVASGCPSQFQIEPAPTSAGVFQGRIYGKPFQAMPFSFFRADCFGPGTLVDIDLDFFIVRSLDSQFYPYTDVEHPAFWLTPAAFVERLGTLSYDMATLAYSVEEGYTPLCLKFLGEELAERLSGSLTEEKGRLFEKLRAAYAVGTRSPGTVLIQELENLGRTRPANAALHFNLFRLYLEHGQIEKARDHYKTAIVADPAYRTAYNHEGPVFTALGDFKKAERSYEQMRTVDQGNLHARFYGMRRALDKKRFKIAAGIGEALREENYPHRELPLALAGAYEGLGQHRRALERLGRYIPSGSTSDAANLLYFRSRARLCGKLGLRDDAMDAYHELLRSWFYSWSVHWNLARLYFLKGNFYKVRLHTLETIKAAFRRLKYFFMRVKRHV